MSTESPAPHGWSARAAAEARLGDAQAFGIVIRPLGRVAESRPAPLPAAARTALRTLALARG